MAQTASTASPAAPLRIAYPEELPVAAHRAEILAALRAYPVVIVCGDTGSGKTTQLPKMALECGFGRKPRRIACTQPRRLAAVTMATRVAAEMNVSVGDAVGFRHRFGRALSAETRVEFLTDGVLLAQTRGDPLLRAYDAIIVDEAHERSLNIDFLLGILKRALARRRDLKVIVSSATLDADRFAAFFDGAPVIAIPGRLFPIETRYRPPSEDRELDLPSDISAAVAELPPRDDILVFLPGEHDIRETAEQLRADYPQDDILPLLASLPAAEQQRVFRLSDRRRIVLATNVAETSVTIPGIRHVIDSGLARLSRYVPRTHVQRLQIEPVSQASARQRAGRCGRLGPGICIRLYAEEDFAAREPFTPPEVLRSSLAGVILTMLDLGLGDPTDFPFLEPPKSSSLREGFRELRELGAVAHDAADRIVLTEIGRKLARIPVEPRLARMLLAAARNAVLPSVLPVVAALACDDPKRRPADEKERAAAQQAHAPFRVPGSDFLGTLAFWRWWCDTAKDLSQSKQRALCKKTYLSYPKMREWRDLTQQLETLARRIGLSFTETGPDFEGRFHRTLLSGLLSYLGKYDSEEGNYRGANGLRFYLHPSSVLTKRMSRPKIDPKVVNAHRPKQGPQGRKPAAPPWIMAGELVDTSRLFAREAAEIDPRWIESVAGDLCRYRAHSPAWDPNTGFVRALETVTLHGLEIASGRRCDWARYDPEDARAIFIRSGLVDGAFPRPPPPVRANNALLDELRRRAETMRRPELFDTARLEAHFAALLPPDVTSADALRKWLRRGVPKNFLLRREDWLTDDDTLSRRDYPPSVTLGNATFRLSYRHTPDDPDTDGITCTVRRSEAHLLRLWRDDWLVPGALPEKLMYLLNALPSSLRRLLSPLADTVSGLLLHLKPGTAPLLEAVRTTLAEEWGIRIPPETWQNLSLPPHLKVRFRILDDATGRPLAVGRNRDAVLAEAGVAAVGVTGSAKVTSQNPANVLSLSSDLLSAGGLNPDDPAALTRLWPFGTIPETAEAVRAGWSVTHYPALYDNGATISRQLYPDLPAARAAHDAALLHLFILALGTRARIPFRRKKLTYAAANYLSALDWSDDRIADDILAGAARTAFLEGSSSTSSAFSGGKASIRSAETFRRQFIAQRSAFETAQAEISARTLQAIDTAGRLSMQLETENLPEETVDAIQTQLAWLVYAGFPRLTPFVRLQSYERYFKGIALRLERARCSPSNDRAKEARFMPYWEFYRESLAEAKTKTEHRTERQAILADIRWMLEEYRISVFAPELHTSEPVSPKRLDAKFAQL